MRNFINIVEAAEIDEEGLHYKGWYNAKTRQWIEMPEGWHHSAFLHHHPEMFDWDNVYFQSADDYHDMYDRMRQLPPKYDDALLHKFIEAGWVRLGMVAETKQVYAHCNSFSDAKKALKFYLKNVVHLDDVEKVWVIDIHGPDKTLDFTQIRSFLRTPVEEGAFDHENQYREGDVKIAAEYANVFWYHGTERLFKTFHNHFIGSMIGNTAKVGFWFAENPHLTGFYGPHQYKVKLHMTNPLIVTDEQFKEEYGGVRSSMILNARRAGYDGIIITDTIDGDDLSTVACCFDTNKIEIIAVGKDQEYIDSAKEDDPDYDENEYMEVDDDDDE